MSGREVNELVVALRPTGVDETTDGLEDAQETFEETADVADESSEDLEGFAQRFEGAMSVAVGALAVATGGLLSTVPVIGEIFAGLGAIIQSIGLRFDDLLRRMGLSSTRLFEIANAIAKAEGPFADFLTTLGLVATSLLAIIAPAALVAAKIKGAGAVFGAVSTAISAVVGGISALTVGLALLTVAAAALAVAWITDFKNIRSTTLAVLDDVFSFAETTFSNFIKLAQLLGQRMVVIFQGWTNTVHRIVVSAMNGIIGAVESAINSVIRTINRFSNITGISLGTVNLGRMAMPDQRDTGGRLAQNRRAIGATLDRQNTAFNQLAESIGQEIDGALPDEIRNTLEIDGKQAAEGTSRWRGSSVANRGR